LAGDDNITPGLHGLTKNSRMQYTFVSMDRQTRKALLQLNRQFYDQYADSFSATRGRVQPGVRQLVHRMMDVEGILDVGCGNGTLARALHKAGYDGRYVGVDVSTGLLHEARALMPASVEGSYDFHQVNLAASDWQNSIQGAPFDWVVCFAVLHHLPGADLRRRTVEILADFVNSEGWVGVSVWQWQNSTRLRKRVLPWSRAGLHPEALDEGDVLLDWRAGDTIGLRFVHTFTEKSLTELAQAGGFTVSETFYSDGRTRDLALYQVWKKKK